MAIRNKSLFSSRNKNGFGLASSTIASLALIVAAYLANQSPDKVEAISPAVMVARYDTIVVPVPADNVPAGTKVKDIRFKNVAFAKQQLPEGSLENIDAYLESATLSVLPANLPLFAKNLSKGSFATNPVLEKIPAGMRAMTVKVDVTSSVEGWAGSGSIVDIMLVEKDRTTVVAEMVKILSAERSVSPVEGAAAPSVPTTLTLLVTQQQCLAINTAIPLGKIAFALRSSQDQEKWGDTRFTSEALRGGTIMRDKKGVINGYFTTKSANQRRSYALSDGKWIETETIPEGYFRR